MSTRNEKYRVVDNRGFVYYIELEHKPHFGFTSAFYNGQIIGQVELGRILQPLSDNDNEWEQYEQRFSEWTDEIKLNMKTICENYFNNNP